jgi:mannitol/fructose-specific phosphotransferase system IIA component (Ntr-type)
VEDAGVPVGLITIEDVLEQVVGQIEDEYPHESRVALPDAVIAGGVILELTANTAEDAIREMTRVITDSKLPSDDIAAQAIAREQEISTDLGCGVAIPHARPQNLSAPLIVVARSSKGIVFSSSSSDPVRLVFLLVTPFDEPDLQLSMLAQLARLAGDVATREKLLKASSTDEIIEIISQFERPAGVLPEQ